MLGVLARPPVALRSLRGELLSVNQVNVSLALS